MSKNIYVTKPYLPDVNEYILYVKSIWESGILTNQGPLLKELEAGIKDYLDVKEFHFVTNGTIALQIAIHALGIDDGEIITTPFSYVATTSSILWERCTPVFVDIESKTFSIDASKIESAITPKTKAIMAVHVFGYPCDVEEIERIAKKHNLKVIYDGAHSFGVIYKGRSLLDYGDISMCSFHATKLFHTIEGGGLVVRDKEVSQKVELIKRFGHEGDDHRMLGINAKASEFQAAMGLANLPKISSLILARKRISELYDILLTNEVYVPKVSIGVEKNYAYYPVVFKDEKTLITAITELNKISVYPRRYFYPSLNKLAYIKSKQDCKTAEDISLRVLCLPLYPELDNGDVKKIATTINSICS